MTFVANQTPVLNAALEALAASASRARLLLLINP
ncbi:uncharacterized protein (DUF1810 family) [Rhodoblastus sphagnicola]|nr:uncharacterized protein (DUF1810 family) [Rhodoblastus sphagnicola]